MTCVEVVCTEVVVCEVFTCTCSYCARSRPALDSGNHHHPMTFDPRPNYNPNPHPNHNPNPNVRVCMLSRDPRTRALLQRLPGVCKWWWRAWWRLCKYRGVVNGCVVCGAGPLQCMPNPNPGPGPSPSPRPGPNPSPSITAAASALVCLSVATHSSTLVRIISIHSFRSGTRFAG